MYPNQKIIINKAKMTNSANSGSGPTKTPKQVQKKIYYDLATKITS